MARSGALAGLLALLVAGGGAARAEPEQSLAESVRPEIAGPASTGLVFERKENGQSDLWRVRLSGAEAIPLFETPEIDETRPAWSQSAQKLLYQAASGGEEQLLIYDPSDGSRVVIRTEERGHKFWGVWSPNGKHVAYTIRSIYPGKGLTTVREWELATGESLILGVAQRHGPVFFRPEYAPDSRRLTAQRRGSPYMQQQIWLLERGHRARPVTPSRVRFDHEARFTRDGEWIVFAAKQTDRPNKLNLIRPDGSERKPFFYSAKGHSQHADPSPTRDEIAFISSRTGNREVYLGDMEQENLRNLSQSGRRVEHEPRWSPDGELLAVEVVDLAIPKKERQRHVAVFDREGNILLETAGESASWMPGWGGGSVTATPSASDGKPPE